MYTDIATAIATTNTGFY